MEQPQPVNESSLIPALPNGVVGIHILKYGGHWPVFLLRHMELRVSSALASHQIYAVLQITFLVWAITLSVLVSDPIHKAKIQFFFLNHLHGVLNVVEK